MKKEILLVLLFIVIVAPSVQVRFLDEYIAQGSNMELHVRIINDLNNDLDNLRVRAYISELGEMFSTTTFNVKDKSSDSRFLYWNTDDYPKGDYLVRIMTSNEDFTNVKYRYITIV